MKVADTRATTTGLKPSRARRSAGDAQFSIAADAQTDAANVSGAAPAAASANVLLAQEVSDPTQERRRARDRAENLLDRLDEIRADILSGRIPAGRLQGLIAALRTQRPDVADPRLIEIIDEIELRAAVEIAKMERYG